MRMRRKRHLDERFETYKGLWIDINKAEADARIAKANKELINFKEIFGNDNPVYLEIGCGKGGYAIAHAQKHPEINILAVEYISNVLIDACEQAKPLELPNLKFLCTGAEYLEKYIAEGSIDRVILNFSTPYQKKAYYKSRLTYVGFLQSYKTLLKDGGKLYQKTDDKDFFDFSLTQYEEIGAKMHFVTRDLHTEWQEENIVTEYEAKFTSLGFKINGAIVSFD
ncbi:MAG: tRNA (guanosine(46)-N7)-methyltransferase TrmB [Bacillota bacterium]